MADYIALRHRGAADAPLLLAFHGTGGTEAQFFDLARQILPEASVVSPRGDVSEGGAARFFRRTGEGVYDMADLAQRTEAMAAFIAAERVGNQPVYAFGYSNGANILASVMFRHPGLVTRAGLLHPLIPWSEPAADLTGRHVLITAGQNDPICPWPMTQALIDWYTESGAALTTEIHDGGHALRDREIAALAELMRA